MIVGFGLDLLGVLGYAPKEGDSSTKDGNRRDPLIGVGDDSTIMGFCLVPDRACWIRATASRAGPIWPWGSGVSRLTRRFLAWSWSTIGLMGPAANRFFLTWGSGNPPSDGGVSELTTMGPIGEAIVPQSAVHERAAFVRLITLVNCSTIARFWALITVPVPVIGNGGPLSSL